MLDTNIVSHLLKAHPAVVQRVTALPMASVCLSSITEAELRYELAKRPDAKRLHRTVDELLLRLDVLPWDSDAAQTYGGIRADLERRGRALASLDLLIAAHAMATGCTLVSNDQVFAQVTGLTLADWTVG